MAFYSARNVNFKIGGSGVFANDVALSTNTSLSSVDRVGSSVSQQFKADQAVSSSLQLNYFLTGVDPIKNNIINQSSYLSVDFGGMYLNSGYLESYSFSAAPYQPIEVSTTIKFFEPVKGSFSPSTSDLSSKSKALVFSDFSISETGILQGGDITSMDYSYSNQINPSYIIQEKDDETHVHNVQFGEKRVEMSFDTDNLQTNLPETGAFCSAEIGLNSLDGVTHESFFVEGRMIAQDSKVGQGQILSRNLKIVENRIGSKPVILSVDPVESVPKGNLVVISGSSFDAVETVTLLDQEVDFSVLGSTGISFVVPQDAHTGPISVHTLGGEATFSGISVI